MTGLRARQKADRTTRIIEAAAQLFRRVGYEAAKMEDIANAAQVSIGTIYNYYQNKGDLLVAIVALEVNEVLTRGERIVDKPPRSAGRAIDRLIGNYIEHSLVYLSKEMWRQAMAISTQQPDSPFGLTYAALDGKLTEQVCQLIAKLQSLGLVTAELDCEAVGEIIFNNTNMMFINFVKSPRMSVKRLRATLARQHQILLKAVAT
jgi:AcrR family transcriptional regulator